VSGVVERKLETARQKALARAAARLVQADLAAAGASIEDAIRDRKWFAFYSVAIDSWDEYSAVMAGALDADQWAEVGNCVIGMRRMDSGFKIAPMQGALGFLNISDKAAKSLRTTHEDARRSFNALCDLAGTSEADFAQERDPRVASEPDAPTLASLPAWRPWPKSRREVGRPDAAKVSP